ncbi:uncharacterized protein N7483_000555 [Penicillium malachiteum]|uniref:uncharacterized protein n=1 Tax=Penicillium malachiteum TaxID=1324776 RepID=UPI002548A6DB|nr:uncharacterized protein N7483_000555 [Penicillium malachiteum]KAJ5735430.1 hypothetical protein N7483_000555 [Penicillium malachiteum]
MFLPSVHAETDTEVLLQFIRENPLGILITGLKSSEQDFLQCTHVPWVLDVPEESEDSSPRIRGHIAKQNPQVKAMIEAVDQKPPNHDHYDPPKFYVETKPDTRKVVPTWNYSAVQVYGKLSLYYDSKTPEAGAFIAQQIHDLSSHTEKSIMGYTGGDRPEAWTVDEAPERYVDLLKRNIMGIEIQVKKIQGKFKMSQEMRSGDREGVVKGFQSMGTETGTAISEMVKGRGELHDLKKAGN